MQVEYLPRGLVSWARQDDEVEPQMAPLERIEEFESELDAINYSVDTALRSQRGLTQMKLADDMRIARAVLTKLKPGQVGMPVSKLISFVRKTRCMAVLQYYAFQLGYVLKSRDDESAQAKRIARLSRKTPSSSVCILTCSGATDEILPDEIQRRYIRLAFPRQQRQAGDVCALHATVYCYREGRNSDSAGPDFPVSVVIALNDSKRRKASYRAAENPSRNHTGLAR